VVPTLGGASCIFLMVYLPPSSWWRFIGWLVLGMSIYFSYGYSQSRVGRAMGRAPRTTPALRAAGTGFLLVAIGLFAIPHDGSLPELLSAALPAAGKASPDHLRSLVGLCIIVAGLGLGAAGLALERRRQTAAPGAAPG